ncbi:hypothetical protein [Sinorhizobium mexicanum]|uniref:Uncharacterized protein n=1 Tax=Sinorhizobium mexicanum TaxID=375549 RepID=A0A859QLU3_9HYPH|nr:hypothetical protein [Sinorhizobium mexicanum]MBP1885034.1 transposase [Sinorhizobium mexicanum]QLL64305.1 hypothetical protein FKV68_22970 [Sinorhizobium mexicanum]
MDQLTLDGVMFLPFAMCSSLSAVRKLNRYRTDPRREERVATLPTCTSRFRTSPPVPAFSLRALVDKVRELDQEIACRARREDVAKRLMAIPGLGPVIATALAAPAEIFMCRISPAGWD